MCVIIIRPPGISISKDTLEECWLANSDGAGLMYAQHNVLHVKKGFFSLKTFQEAYKRAPEDVSCVLHFRVATSGLFDWNNCHPHMINRGLAFVHNGIITTSATKKLTESDTVWFNREVLRRMPSNFHLRDDLVSAIEGMIGPHNKIVVMDRFGRIVLLNKETFDIYEGCIFSNLHWQRSSTKLKFQTDPLSNIDIIEMYCPECYRSWKISEPEQSLYLACPDCGTLLEYDGVYNHGK